MRIMPFTARLGAAAALLLALSGCKSEVLRPAGDIAARQKDLLLAATGLMLIIIVPVMVLTVLFAWRYRASNQRATYRPDWDHSTKFELVIWAAPLLIIISLGALTWVGTHLLDPWRPLDRISATAPAPDRPPLRVEVVALDWKWLFIYPDEGVASVNELAIPVDREIEFSLTSSSVMNAFYIPAMAGMVYAMPGMETRLHGVFNRAGAYQGLASHYSGWGFSGMRFRAEAMDAKGFGQWIDGLRATGGRLDRAGYLALARPSENVAPIGYGDVDPELFDRVVNMCVEPGRICMAEMMALDARGGTGLAGTMNTVPRAALPGPAGDARAAAGDDAADAGHGLGRPVLGRDPFMVTGFCTPADSARMFATLRDARAPAGRGAAPAAANGPVRGLGLPRPENRLGIPGMPQPIRDARRSAPAPNL